MNQPTDPHFPRCQNCGKPAHIHDIDGSWCDYECQILDRGNETTWWRRAMESVS
jgi:lysyl-tRNA synthetase class I